MLRKYVLIALLLLLCPILSSAHGSWEQHADDMYEVLGLERNEKLTNWMRFVSSVLIDNNNADCAFSDNGEPFDFYAYLKEKYPGFQCKHRLLFHWGYNSRPWSLYLQDKVEGYGWSDTMIKSFQADLIAEQKRRNGFANHYTEDVFSLEHAGKEARVARVLISIVYDVHLLGDYEPDNTDLDGLQDISSVVGDLINNINALDKSNGSVLCKQLKKISQSQEYGVQEKASALLRLLKDYFGDFLKVAQDGNVANHLSKHGFFFVGYSENQSRFEDNSTPRMSTDKKVRKQSSLSGGGVGVVVFISIIVLIVLLVILFKK